MSYYGIARLIFIAILFLVITYFIRKSKLQRKKLWMYFNIAVMVLVATVINFLPIENLFINFSTPEDVFNYTSFGKIVKIIDGNDSCMIVYKKGDALSTEFTKKENNAYKITTYFDVSSGKLTNKKYTAAQIYTVKGTNDSYSLVSALTADENTQITDNYGNEYSRFKAFDMGYCYVAYLNSFDQDYQNYKVIVN